MPVTWVFVITCTADGLVFHPAPCEAVKIFLSVDKTDLTRGDYFTVNIVLDNAGGIVGCSFSVHLMVF